VEWSATRAAQSRKDRFDEIEKGIEEMSSSAWRD
jgi:hypothetical protein